MVREDDMFPALEPGLDCETAFRRIALRTAAEIDAGLALFFGSEGHAGPHKSRVALRRLTAALDGFEPVLRRKVRQGLRAEAKRIFRKLGEQRDSDVYLAGLGAARRSKAALARNAALRERLRDDLRARKAVAFAPRLQSLTESGEIFRRGAGALALRQGPAADLAAEALEIAWQDCLAHGTDLAAMKDEVRHDLRKAVKDLRYLSEFFAPLWPGVDAAPVLARMAALQDALGTLTDLRAAELLRKGRADAAARQRAARALKDAGQLWQTLCAAPVWWPERDANRPRDVPAEVAAEGPAKG